MIVGRSASPEENAEAASLLTLLGHLKSEDYEFIAVTPATHQCVLARAAIGPASLRDIFGWNRQFAVRDLDADLFEQLEAAGIVVPSDAGWRSTVRVSSLSGDLFLHSSFPTDQHDAVFFGPDTYRFGQFISTELGRPPAGSRIVDMGAGSGAGGLLCARLSPDCQVTLVDINPEALRYAAISAAAAGVVLSLEHRDSLPSGADIVVSNPPYMIDAAGREYRDGGDLLGGSIALQWVRQALVSMRPGGRMLLYTGVAFVDGKSPALEAIKAECTARAATVRAREIDPDVFGEELSGAAYARVERIAAVGCIITMPG